MAKNNDHVKKGGYATIVGKGSRLQETLFNQGYNIVDPVVAFRLGWFKPMRSGPNKQNIYGLEYGHHWSKYLRF